MEKTYLSFRLLQLDDRAKQIGAFGIDFSAIVNQTSLSSTLRFAEEVERPEGCRPSPLDRFDTEPCLESRWQSRTSATMASS